MDGRVAFVCLVLANSQLGVDRNYDRRVVRNNKQESISKWYNSLRVITFTSVLEVSNGRSILFMSYLVDAPRLCNRLGGMKKKVEWRDLWQLRSSRPKTKRIPQSPSSFDSPPPCESAPFRILLFFRLLSVSTMKRVLELFAGSRWNQRRKKETKPLLT